jgi:hypothetical protein
MKNLVYTGDVSVSRLASFTPMESAEFEAWLDEVAAKSDVREQERLEASEVNWDEAQPAHAFLVRGGVRIPLPMPAPAKSEPYTPRLSDTPEANAYWAWATSPYIGSDPRHATR